MSERSAFDAVGGADAVRALVNRFYDLMEFEGAYTGIRALHPSTLDGSRDKLYLFLSGWLGGPGLYVQRFGHPRLRARHLPYAIGSAERDQWLGCMRKAMHECELDPALQERLSAAFANTADWMRNKGG